LSTLADGSSSTSIFVFLNGSRETEELPLADREIRTVLRDGGLESTGEVRHCIPHLRIGKGRIDGIVVKLIEWVDVLSHGGAGKQH